MERGCDFLFVFPKSVHGFSLGNTFEGFDYHLGASYIRAYLEIKEVTSDVYISHGASTLVDCAKEIVDFMSPIVGFSVYDSNYHMCKLLAKEIKALSPNTCIVFGGPTATFSDMIIMNDCNAVDICIRSYGEETSYEIYRSTKGGTPLSSITGVTYRESGAIKRNKDKTISAAITSFDKVGKNGCLDLFPDPYIQGYIPVERVADIGIVTSRGCTYPCTFCNCSAISNRRIYHHSHDRMLDIFNYLEKNLRKNTLVAINDDNFSLRRNFHKILDDIKQCEYKKITFWAEMRTEPLSDKTFSLLKHAGFEKIHFGLESGVPEVLANIKKVRSKGWENDNYKKEKEYLNRIKWAVESSKEHGISPGVSIILGNPGETIEQGKATLEFVKKLDIDRYAHNFLVIQDGTELSRTHSNYGIAIERSIARPIPARTKLTYDVTKLPILEEDGIWLSHNSSDLLQAQRLVSGSMFSFAIENNDEDIGLSLSDRTDKYLISIAIDALHEVTYQWLKLEIPLNSSIWITHSATIEPHEINEKLSFKGVPVQQVNTLSTVKQMAGGEKIRINELSSSTPDKNTRILLSSTLKDYFSNQLLKETWGARKGAVARIENTTDIRKLIRYLKTRKRMYTISGAIVDSNLSIEDECRWSCDACPSTKGKRWFVTENKKVLSCPNGVVVGQVGDSLGKLNEKFLNIFNTATKKRDCINCAVYESCAKCVAPHIFSQEEYCKFQKSNPDLRRIISLLELNRVLSFSDIKHQKYGRVKATYPKKKLKGYARSLEQKIKLADCVLVKVKGKGKYLYHKRTANLIDLTKMDYKIFEVLYRG